MAPRSRPVADLLKHVPAARGRRVGLFGGSFNPAHEGHRHASLEALRRLGLDEVWWLVAPQNPLKETAGMAPLAERLAGAAAVAGHPRIRVGAPEADLGTRRTADTVAALRRRHPRLRFVWLMGADLLVQVSRWYRWWRLFDTVPVAILDRPSYSREALASKAARRYARFRLPERQAWQLAEADPPAWSFLHIPLHPASATQIRARLVARDRHDQTS